MVRLGAGAYVGLGLLTYATNGAAADMDLFFMADEATDSLQLERDRLEFMDLTSDFEMQSSVKAGHRRVTGSLKLKATYGGMQDLLRAITGHNIAPSGAGPYTYAFVPVFRSNSAHYIFGTTNRAWCIEVFRGGGYANSVFYQGCVITSVKLSFKPNSYVEVELSFIGRGFSISAKTASPTFKTSRIITPTGQTETLQLGGVGYVCRSADIEINVGIEPRHDVTDIESLMPMPSAKQSVKLTAEIEYDDEGLLNKLDNPDTQQFPGGQLSIVQSATDSLTFLFDELVLESPAEPRTKGLGVVLTQLSMTAKASSPTVASYSASLITGEAAYNT